MGTLRSYSTSCILTHRLVLWNWLAIRGFHKYADPWSSIPFIRFLGAPFHKASCIEKSLEYALCPICRLNVGALIIPGGQVQWQRVEWHIAADLPKTRRCAKLWDDGFCITNLSARISRGRDGKVDIGAHQNLDSCFGLVTKTDCQLHVVD